MNKVIKKITANNGGVFTGNGTNTYLIGHEDITLVDPGPNSPEHIDRILLEGGDKIKRILVTHTHTDHSPAALPISKKLNIPMFGRLVDRESQWEDETFIPDNVLSHGDIISTDEYSLETIHTPGHASNHLCFYLKENKCLLTGDHIAPGHGNFMQEPDKTIQSIIRHRLSRESKVLRCVEKQKNSNLDELLLLVYDDVPEVLHPIAKMSLLAHLIKLEDEGKLNNSKNNYSLS